MGVGVLSRYGPLLPITGDTPRVTLGEGDTPLIASRHLAGEVGCDQVYLKLEGCNPTGSFKDRGSSVMVSVAREHGVTEIVEASSGTAGASVAAYAVRAGIMQVVYPASMCISFPLLFGLPHVAYVGIIQMR